jgi:hypothetical protein
MTLAATATARKIKATTMQQANSWGGCWIPLHSINSPCYYDIMTTAIAPVTAATAKQHEKHPQQKHK